MSLSRRLFTTILLSIVLGLSAYILQFQTVEKPEIDVSTIPITVRCNQMGYWIGLGTPCPNLTVWIDSYTGELHSVEQFLIKEKNDTTKKD